MSAAALYIYQEGESEMNRNMLNCFHVLIYNTKFNVSLQYFFNYSVVGREVLISQKILD